MSIDKIKKIVYFLTETDETFKTIAEEVGVCAVSVGDIFYRRTYKIILKDYIFLPRKEKDYGSFNRTIPVEIIRRIVKDLMKNELTTTEIKRKYGCAKGTIEDIYRKKIWRDVSEGRTFPPRIKKNKKSVFRYNESGKLITEYESLLDVYNKTGYSRSVVKIKCMSFLKKYRDSYWSFEKNDNYFNIPLVKEYINSNNGDSKEEKK